MKTASKMTKTLMGLVLLQCDVGTLLRNEGAGTVDGWSVWVGTVVCFGTVQIPGLYFSSFSSRWSGLQWTSSIFRPPSWLYGHTAICHYGYHCLCAFCLKLFAVSSPETDTWKEELNF